MEAFSDGVIAVVITIMVLELKVPSANGPAGLLALVPTLAIYLLSFTFTGVYWVNHHHLVDRLEAVDALVLWANLLFLFCLSLLPFFTAYLIDKHEDVFSVQIYAGSLLVTGLGFQGLSRAIARNRHTACRDEAGRMQGDREHLAEIAKGWLSLALYLIAMPLAHWHARLALGLCSAVTLLWILPGLGLRHERATGTEI